MEGVYVIDMMDVALFYLRYVSGFEVKELNIR